MSHGGRGDRAGAGLLVLVSLAVIALTTLRANPSQLDRIAETAWTCLVCGDAGTTDVLLNLLLFAPLGVGLRWRGWSGGRAVLAICLLTLAIEGTQAFALAGRDATISDVLANSLGGAIGWWGWPRLVGWADPAVAEARRGAAVIAAVSTLAWLGTGWGLHPDGSPERPWVGQPLHQWRGHDPFPGTLQRVALNGIDVPNDPLSRTPDLNDSLVLEIALTRQDTTPPGRPVSLLRIVDARGRPQLAVTQRGEALLATVRARASAWRVRTPTWRVDNAMVMPGHVPWRLQWAWHADRIELQAGPADGPVTRRRTIPISIGLGWAFVHPFAAPIGSPLADAWTAIWLALWGLPLGWCLGWLRRTETLLGVALMLAAYLGASAATGLPIQGWEAGMLGASMAAGIAAGNARNVKRAARREEHGSAV